MDTKKHFLNESERPKAFDATQLGLSPIKSQSFTVLSTEAVAKRPGTISLYVIEETALLCPCIVHNFVEMFRASWIVTLPDSVATANSAGLCGFHFNISMSLSVEQDDAFCACRTSNKATVLSKAPEIITVCSNGCHSTA